MVMQRIARFLLWGGLALLILGIGSCGVGCVAGLGAVVEGIEGSEADAAALGDTMAGASIFGIIAIVISLAMVLMGAILKAVSPKSRERD